MLPGPGIPPLRESLLRHVGLLDSALCEIHEVMLDACGASSIAEIRLKFTEHIPHQEIMVPLMRVMGGAWAQLLADIERNTRELKAKKAGAGAGVDLAKEGDAAVKKGHSP